MGGFSRSVARSATQHGNERLDVIALTLASGQTLRRSGTGGEKLVGPTFCHGKKDHDNDKG
jgi:hypothetical protein